MIAALNLSHQRRVALRLLQPRAIGRSFSFDVGDVVLDPLPIRGNLDRRAGAGLLDVQRGLCPHGLDAGRVLRDRFLLRNLKMTSGVLIATGNAEISPTQELSGQINVDLGGRIRGTVGLSGKLKDPLLR